MGEVPEPTMEIRNSGRAAVQASVVHHYADVTVGPGPFDTIRIHRVVREARPDRLAPATNAVMLLPGSPTFFEMLYMPSLTTRALGWDRSLAVFLAQNGIDVWGMDYAWALVPQETTDFGFMKEWDLEKDAGHVQVALSIARGARAIFDQPVRGPLHLLGLSYGGLMAYAVAGAETALPQPLRNVKGIIPLDVGMKFEQDPVCAAAYEVFTQDQAKLASGQYHSNFGVFGQQLADLALSAPQDKPSLLDPDLTNYQAALAFGTSPIPPTSWHFAGSWLDANGIPSGLRYIEPQVWFDSLKAMPPYNPVQVEADIDAMWSGKVEVPFDDRLAEIEAPILYVGAAGGFGCSGNYTTTLTASRDVTTFTVQLLPDDQRMMDFGHGDLVLARNARELVWQPILEWIHAHR